MLAVQVRSCFESDEELRTVGVRPRVGHGKETRPIMFDIKFLIRELATVDRLASSAISSSEVTTLCHETSNHPMEVGASIAVTLLSSSERTEILSCLGNDVIEESEDKATLLVNS